MKREARRESRHEKQVWGSTMEQSSRTLQGVGQDGLKCTGDDYGDVVNEDGYPYCYSCNIAPGTETKFIRVQYDYELVWQNQENDRVDFAHKILPKLEWGILDQVAEDFFLRNCQLERQKGNFTIVGVSSLYLDYRDIDVDQCQYLSEPEMECTPVSGSMTAEYIGDDSDAVNESLLNAISIVMEEHRGIGGHVKGTLFIGDRKTYASDREFVAKSVGEQKEGLETGSIAASASAILVILLLIGAFILMWRRNSLERKRVVNNPLTDLETPAESMAVPTFDNDVEIPSSPPCSPPRHRSDSGDEHSIIPLAEHDEEAKPSDVVTTDEVAEREQVETADALLFEPALPPTIRRSSSPPALKSPLSADSTDSENAVPGDTDTNNSQKDGKSETLKKHRKKKKKKFKTKVTLVRVNSRENVASMETISETDEQEMKDDLDGDAKQTTAPVSTYSTSDEESSNYSTTSSDNEQDAEREAERPVSRSPARRRGDLPPLPPVEF